MITSTGYRWGPNYDYSLYWIGAYWASDGSFGFDNDNHSASGDLADIFIGRGVRLVQAINGI